MSALQTNDLRSEAKAYQRDKNHATKWARGASTAPGVRCTHVDLLSTNTCDQCAARPNHRDYDRRCGRNFSRAKHLFQNKSNSQAATLARKAFRNEVVDALDGPLANVSDTSSEEEDVKDASAAPTPGDEDFMYSYDAVSGPSSGSNILTYAITQAIQRFENNETEKLVNKEYDMVEDSDRKECAEGYTADVDDEFDFELVDYTHLN